MRNWEPIVEVLLLYRIGTGIQIIKQRYQYVSEVTSLLLSGS
jgi:hypothetical protein